MSEASSRASADSTWGLNVLGSTSAGNARSTPTAALSSPTAGPESSATRTFETSTETRSELISSQEDFPVRTFPPLTADSTSSDFGARSLDSGESSDESSTFFSLSGSWLRTALNGEPGFPKLKLTLPRWAMGVRRSNSQPARLALPTSARGSSWLPTPTATANQLAPSMRKHKSCLLLQDLTGSTGGKPHPEVFEWLMGFPERWTDLEHSETPSSRKSRKQSDE